MLQDKFDELVKDHNTLIDIYTRHKDYFTDLQPEGPTDYLTKDLFSVSCHNLISSLNLIATILRLQPSSKGEIEESPIVDGECCVNDCVND